MRKPSVRPPQLTGAAAVLFDAMSHLSEAAHDVRWARDTEYGVWRLLISPGARWGAVRAYHADVRPALVTIEALSRQAGCWVMWPAGSRGPRPVDLRTWWHLYDVAGGILTGPRRGRAAA